MSQLHQMTENLCFTYLANYSPSTLINTCGRSLRIYVISVSARFQLNKYHVVLRNHGLTIIIKSLSHRKHRLYKRTHQSGLSSDWLQYYQSKKGSQQQFGRAYNNYIYKLAVQGRLEIAVAYRVTKE